MQYSCTVQNDLESSFLAGSYDICAPDTSPIAAAAAIGFEESSQVFALILSYSERPTPICSFCLLPLSPLLLPQLLSRQQVR